MNLTHIRKGPQLRPHFIGLYGPGGIGKSTFGASAPNPVFLGTDDGVGALDVASFPTPRTWLDVRGAVNTLINDKHDFESLVIDTVNGLEPLVWAHVCHESNCKSIEDVDGGFGKGYVRAEEQWVEFWKSLKVLRNKMNVICLGHAKVKTVEYIEDGERFDRYIHKMNDRAADLFHEAVDCMFFANFKMSFRKEKGARKSRASSEGRRVMYTEEKPAFRAKNRFSLPPEMELSWAQFVTAAQSRLSTPKITLEEVFKGREKDALDYLISIGWLKDGQAISDLQPPQVQPILTRSASFIEAINAYVAERDAEPESTEPQP